MADYLYIHVPFCVRKCIYCDFLSVSYDRNLARNYVDALCAELLLKRNSAGKLKTVYIGGGTPSLLPPDYFRRLFECIRGNFDLFPDAEVTVEANPGTLNAEGLETLLSLGVNRISLGVQSFNDAELRTLGRIHGSADAARAIDLVKAAGVESFSLDLIYAIPGQTMGTWQQTLSDAAGFSPAHISAYELTPETSTPLYSLIETGRMKMPDEEIIVGMYEYSMNYLSACGYGHYEISNHASPGFRCIHNLNYWDRGEYVGAGAGAHSFVEGVRSNTTVSIEGYIESLRRGMLPQSDSVEITRIDALKESIFLGLRKTEGIKINDLGDKGILVPEACRDLIDEGYLSTDGICLRLTRKGLILSNTVIVEIFERLAL